MCHFFSAGPSVSPIRLRAKVAFMSIDHFLKQFTNHVPFLSLTLSWILSFRGILYFLSNTISNRLFTVQFTVDQAFIKMKFFFLPFYYLKMSVYIILKHNQWLYISLIYCCTDIFFYWIECDSSVLSSWKCYMLLSFLLIVQEGVNLFTWLILNLNMPVISPTFKQSLVLRNINNSAGKWGHVCCLLVSMKFSLQPISIEHNYNLLEGT